MDSNEEIRSVLDKLDEILGRKRKALEEQEAEAREARERLARYEGWEAREPETAVETAVEPETAGEPDTYGTFEAAKIFGVSRETIRRRIMKGDIYAYRCGPRDEYHIPSWAIQDAVGLEPTPEPTSAPTSEDYLTVPEAAERIGIGPATLYQHISAGKLRYRHLPQVIYKKTRLMKKYIHKNELARYARKKGLRYNGPQ
jgi:predicted DNA-binding transcriptional regulator AlpA